MASIFLSDILARNGLKPKRVKLIRHSVKNISFEKCYKSGFLKEYQKIQSPTFFNNCDYVLTFISEPGTSAKFEGCYSVGNGIAAKPELMTDGFPVPSMFNGKDHYYELTESDVLTDLKNRLIINWGKGTIAWNQWATNDKEVLAIQQNPKLMFCGYENVLLSYSQLKEIVDDCILYENWHTALSSVYAVYLIVDTNDGKQYVGSAYGDGGLLSRWKYYVSTAHGGNKAIIGLICNFPDRYHHFKFSILQILPKTVTLEDVIAVENLFKNKLLTKTFGLNEN